MSLFIYLHLPYWWFSSTVNATEKCISCFSATVVSRSHNHTAWQISIFFTSQFFSGRCRRFQIQCHRLMHLTDTCLRLSHWQSSRLGDRNMDPVVPRSVPDCTWTSISRRMDSFLCSVSWSLWWIWMLASSLCDVCVITEPWAMGSAASGRSNTLSQSLTLPVASYTTQPWQAQLQARWLPEVHFKSCTSQKDGRLRSGSQNGAQYLPLLGGV